MVFLCIVNPLVIKLTFKLLPHTGPKNACLPPVMTHASPLSHTSLSQDTSISRRGKDRYENQVCIQCVCKCTCLRVCVCVHSQVQNWLWHSHFHRQHSLLVRNFWKNAACLETSFNILAGYRICPKWVGYRGPAPTHVSSAAPETRTTLWHIKIST